MGLEEDLIFKTKAAVFDAFVKNEANNLGQAFVIENIWFGVYLGLETDGPYVYEGKGVDRKQVGTDKRHSLIRFRCYKKLVVGPDREHTHIETFDQPIDMTFCVSDIGIAYKIPNHLLDE